MVPPCQDDDNAEKEPCKLPGSASPLQTGVDQPDFEHSQILEFCVGERRPADSRKDETQIRAQLLGFIARCRPACFSPILSVLLQEGWILQQESGREASHY